MALVIVGGTLHFMYLSLAGVGLRCGRRDYSVGVQASYRVASLVEHGL